MSRQLQYSTSSSSSYGYGSGSSTVSSLKKPRCTNNYALSQTSSGWGSTSTTPVSESELLKYSSLNMDLKELNDLFKDLHKKKTQKNSNLGKLNKKKKQNNTKSNRNSIERRYNEEVAKFNKTFKKILSEKIKQKTIDRLHRLIKKPKEKRLNNVACVLTALIEVLKSCNISTSYEDLIRRYKEKIPKEKSELLYAVEEFIKDILEKNESSLNDFIAKQSTHKKELGKTLMATIKTLPTCNG